MANIVIERRPLPDEILDTWRSSRPEFGEFVDAFMANPQHSSRTHGRTAHLEGDDDGTEPAPGLVLVDEDGNELWLYGLVCGYWGAGPRVAMNVLFAEGFDLDSVVQVGTAGYLHLSKNGPGEYVPRFPEPKDEAATEKIRSSLADRRPGDRTHDRVGGGAPV